MKNKFIGSNRKLKALILISVLMFCIPLISATFNWTDNILAYYDFKSTTNLTNILNSSLYNGTPVNTPTTNVSVSIMTPAWEFDSASTEYVNITDIPFGGKNGSINMWVQPSFAGTDSGTNRAFWYNMYDTSKWLLYHNDLFYFMSGGSQNNTVDTDGMWNAGDWIMLTATWSLATNNSKLYLNGQVIINHTGVNASYYPVSLAGRALLGGQIPFDGNISETGIWNRTLNSSEVTELYQDGFGLSYGDNFEISQKFNSTAYETAYERFSINITYNSSLYTISANLSYNGTSYAGTKSGSGNTVTFYKDLSMDSPYGNKSIQWTLRLISPSGTRYVNSTLSSHIVNPIIFGICNSTLQVKYLNFTFKNEANDTYISAVNDLADFDYWIGDGSETRSYSYSNTNEFSNYTFCFSPNNTQVTIDLSFKYSSTGFPQRTFSYDNQVLTNTTTNKVLYLLSSSDGIYSTYIAVNSANSPLSGVTVQVEREFAGVWTILTQGTTDSSGAVTFWLSPNYLHRITATKTGYGQTQVEITPSSSTYTIYMGSSNLINYTMETEGMTWIITPQVGLLNSSTWTFGFNLTASKNNIVSCKMELLNNNSVVLDSTTGCSSSGGYISIDLDMTPHKKVYGRYSIDIGSGYVIIDSDAFWINYPVNKSSATIVDWLNDLRTLDLSYFGNDETHREYTLIVLTFLAIMLIAASLSYMGWDWQTEGGIILFVWVLILIASLSGFLNLAGISPYSWMDKYFVVFTFSLFAGGYIFRHMV